MTQNRGNKSRKHRQFNPNVTKDTDILGMENFYLTCLLNFQDEMSEIFSEIFLTIAESFEKFFTAFQ